MLGEDGIPSALVARQRKQYVIGLALLFVVVLEWTGSNFLTQNLFDDGYNKPFFVTYMNTASFSLYLLPAFVKYVVEKRNSDKTRREQGYQALVDTDDEAHMAQEQCATSTNTQQIHTDGCHTGQSPLSMPETAKLAAAFCVLWFLANWSINASLGFTSVASTTILSSMSGFFTLLIGRIFRVESLDLGKIAAVTISFIGSLLVSLADKGNDGTDQSPKVPGVFSHPHPQAILGDFLALGSALFYALYVVLLKVQIGDESRINMQLFFGFVGIFNILGFWPIGAILHVTGLEVFELPNSKKALYAVLLNMFITLSSDFIYVLAMLKTTPLVVTVGLSLTIPLAIGGDLFLGSPTSVQSLIGATLVLIAFIVIGLEDRDGGTHTSIEGPPDLEDDRGRSAERPNGFSQVPLLDQAEDDESLRKSVEAIFAARREQDRRARRESHTRGSHSSNDQATRTDGRPNPLDRGRSRTRSGTFRRERVSGSLRRSEERRTRSRTGRKSSSEQDDASRRDVRAQGWDYDHPILSDSEENAEV